MDKKFRLAGIKKFLLPRSRREGLLAGSRLARSLSGSSAQDPAREKGGDLVDFLKQVHLFKDFRQGDLKRLARLVHERAYGDGEYIYEQGNPGVALYIVRSGVVEIARRKRNGEEVLLASLESPDSLEELAAVGDEVVRLTSARARGPVSLVAIGRSDMDALSHNFPILANKILVRLAQVMAMRMQILLEAEYFSEESEE
jgi:CRP-like cAMP-binding protein